jgi:ATPase involved in DNA replication initiation
MTFCISQSNQDVYDYLFKWPSWESNILNIHGPGKSGKTFLLNNFCTKAFFYKNIIQRSFQGKN